MLNWLQIAMLTYTILFALIHVKEMANEFFNNFAFRFRGAGTPDCTKGLWIGIIREPF